MSDEKRITILLTDQAPVAIVDAQWPVIMTHEETRINSQMEPVVQSRVTVRRSDEGTHLVYGEGLLAKGGYVVPPGVNVAGRIELLCMVIGIDRPHAFARECIQKLPAVNI